MYWIETLEKSALRRLGIYQNYTAHQRHYQQEIYSLSAHLSLLHQTHDEIQDEIRESIISIETVIMNHSLHNIMLSDRQRMQLESHLADMKRESRQLRLRFWQESLTLTKDISQAKKDLLNTTLERWMLDLVGTGNGDQQR